MIKNIETIQELSEKFINGTPQGFEVTVVGIGNTPSVYLYFDNPFESDVEEMDLGYHTPATLFIKREDYDLEGGLDIIDLDDVQDDTLEEIEYEIGKAFNDAGFEFPSSPEFDKGASDDTYAAFHYSLYKA